VKAEQLPYEVKWAFILAEDASFLSHKGFDWFEISESFKKNIREMKYARGGSTITQQLAKNMFLSSEKSILRKIKELVIAKRLEENWSKEAIFQAYLNVIEFGDNIYGIRQAAFHYFKKAPRSLSAVEGIFLASLLPSPVRFQKNLVDGEIHKRQKILIETIAKRMKRFNKLDSDYVEAIVENLEYKVFFPEKLVPNQIDLEELEPENSNKNLQEPFYVGSR
jgi:monofunctional biosynthetic peptidoglycan transglycosylase